MHAPTFFLYPVLCYFSLFATICQQGEIVESVLVVLCTVLLCIPEQHLPQGMKKSVTFDT